MTDAELATIEARATAATPSGFVTIPTPRADVVFMEHARADVLALVREVRRREGVARAAQGDASSRDEARRCVRIGPGRVLCGGAVDVSQWGPEVIDASDEGRAKRGATVATTCPICWARLGAMRCLVALEDLMTFHGYEDRRTRAYHPTTAAGRALAWAVSTLAGVLGLPAPGEIER